MNARLAAGLLAAVIVLAAAGFGVTWLRATAPTAATDLVVADVPPLAVEELESCERVAGSDSDDAERTARQGTRGVGGRVASGQLYECPDAFDGLQVTYVGEVIGDVLRRGSGAWALVNDDAYALDGGPLPAHGDFAGLNSGVTVWLPAPLTDRVDGVGGPGVRGTVIAVDGTVERTDPADGGGLTIRADTLEVLAPARALAQPVHLEQAVSAGVLALAGLLLLHRRRTVRR